MYKIAFWFLLAWTVISLILLLRGYDLLNSVMIVLVIDLIALAIIVEMGKKKSFQDVSSEIKAKIENIEKVCQNILNSSSDDSIISKIEERINKQKEEVNYLLDRMSRKSLELEEKINNFGYNLAEHVEDFGKRLEKLENPGEKFSIGETVYVEDENEEEEQEQE